MKHLYLTILVFSFGFCGYSQKIDCTNDPEANSAKNRINSNLGDGQGCAMAAQFFAYLCECKNNPRSEQQADMLKNTLSTIRSQYYAYGNKCNGKDLPGLQGGCRVVNEDEESRINNGQNAINPDKGRILNPQLVNLLNAASLESSDEDFKKMVEFINEKSSTAQSLKSLNLQYGNPTQSDIDFFNQAENMAIIVGVLGYINSKMKAKKEIKRAEEKRELEILLEEDRLVKEYVDQLSKNIASMRVNIGVMKEIDFKHPNAMGQINKYEQRLAEFERSTIPARLLVLEFFKETKKYLYTFKDLEDLEISINAKVNSFSTKDLLAWIDTFNEEKKENSDLFPLSDSYPHLLNNEISFRNERSEILWAKYNYYLAKNIQDSANVLLLELPENTNLQELSNSINRSFYNYRDEEAIKKYVVFKQMLEQVKNEERLDSFNELSIEELLASISAGARAHYRCGNNTRANNELNYLKVFYQWNQTYNLFGNMANYTDLSPAIIAHTEAIIKFKMKQDSALMMVNSAIDFYNKENIEIYTNNWPYDLDLKMTKIKILENRKDFDQALQVAKEMQQTKDLNRSIFVNLNDLKFNEAILLYKSNQYDRALSMLTLLKVLDPNQPKHYLLEKEIHITLNNQPDAQIAANTYIQLISENKK